MKIDQPQKANEICRISEGARINGVLNSVTDIRIDGIFEGTMATKGRLVIGEKALVKGNIFCQNVDIWGKIEGNLFVSECFSLKESANFSGELKTAKINIEMGAVFNGPCTMIRQEDFNKAYNECFPSSDVKTPVPEKK